MSAEKIKVAPNFAGVSANKVRLYYQLFDKKRSTNDGSTPGIDNISLPIQSFPLKFKWLVFMVNVQQRLFLPFFSLKGNHATKGFCHSLDNRQTKALPL